MAIDFLYPQYEVVRNPARCIACRAVNDSAPTKYMLTTMS